LQQAPEAVQTQLIKLTRPTSHAKRRQQKQQLSQSQPIQEHRKIVAQNNPIEMIKVQDLQMQNE